jgi:hypothetical protein
MLCWSAVPGKAIAQPELSHRPALIIPPSHVLSVQTDAIRAQAQYLQASGDFLVSAAIARRHHSLAAQQEIRNHAEWVKTYFELKDLNKAYYLKEHPPYVDRAERRREQLERAIVDNPQLALEGDVGAATLNWLLYRIATTALAAEVLNDSRDAGAAVLEQALLPADLHHIILTDGSKKGGRKIVFRAAEARGLETAWPFALRGPEFDRARARFEQDRDNAVREITTTHQLSYASQIALLGAVDELMVTLQREHPKQRRHATGEAWENYSQANNFLQSLALSVKRVIDTNDRQPFDGSLQFQGDSVFQLVQHLCRHGLEFGPPQAGDEGVYRKLFLAMRNIYLDTRIPLQRGPFE